MVLTDWARVGLRFDSLILEVVDISRLTGSEEKTLLIRVDGVFYHLLVLYFCRRLVRPWAYLLVDFQPEVDA